MLTIVPAGCGYQESRGGPVRVDGMSVGRPEVREMATVTIQAGKKNLSQPDEIRSFPKGRVEVVKIGDHVLMRATFEPGWRWSEHVKPKVGTELCEVGHLGYVISGRLATRFRDGREIVSVPGDFVVLPPGHDGWVVGDEPAVLLDFLGGEIYAKPRA